MSNKKQCPSELVSQCSISNKGNWYDKLTLNNRKYVDRVIEVMREMPEAAPYVVAEKLRETLHITVSVGNVAKKLKELVRNV